jgi:hypothetical protein
VPSASGAVSSRTERKPIGRCQLSNSTPDESVSVTFIGYRACPPYPRGHHSSTSGRRTRRTVSDTPAGTTARTRRPAIVAVTVTGSAARAQHSPMWTSTCPVRPVTVTSGRTVFSRAVDQVCSPIGCQMPAVTSVGPQSQPKLQAILRMKLNGSA